MNLLHVSATYDSYANLLVCILRLRLTYGYDSTRLPKMISRNLLILNDPLVRKQIEATYRVTGLTLDHIQYLRQYGILPGGPIFRSATWIREQMEKVRFTERATLGLGRLYVERTAIGTRWTEMLDINLSSKKRRRS